MCGVFQYNTQHTERIYHTVLHIVQERNVFCFMLGYLLGGQFDLFTLLIMVTIYMVIAFVVFPARGFAQAYIANQLGDPTARFSGRMTMNPRAHIDLFGTIILFVCGIGFVKPVPMNPHNFRKPRTGIILTALAGPVMGVLMGAIGIAIYRICLMFIKDYQLLSFLQLTLVQIFALTNIRLAVFTLLPLPFLDGYTILSLFLPPRWVYFIQSNSMYATLLVLILIFSGAVDYPVSFLSNLILNGIGFLFGFH